MSRLYIQLICIGNTPDLSNTMASLKTNERIDINYLLNCVTQIIITFPSGKIRSTYKDLTSSGISML